MPLPRALAVCSLIAAACSAPPPSSSSSPAPARIPAPDASPAAPDSYARWQAAPGAWCANALEWLEDGTHVSWSYALAQPFVAQPCLATVDPALAPERAFGNVVTHGDLVIAAGAPGILLLSRRDGSLQLALPTPPGDDPPIFFDQGTFQLESRPACHGDARQAHVLATCDDLLVSLQGTTAILLDLDTRVVRARARATRADATYLKRGVETEAAIHLGTDSLHLRGITFM